MPTDFNWRWTDEMDQRLIARWQDGDTATEIYCSCEFPGFTRNAIIGRLFRLRKKRGEQIVEQRDPDPVPKKRKRRPNYSASEHAPRPPVKILPPSSPLIARRLPLLELGPHDCRFIITHEAKPVHLYCAVDASDFVDEYGGNCYCAFHQRLMRSPSPLRRL